MWYAANKRPIDTHRRVPRTLRDPAGEHKGPRRRGASLRGDARRPGPYEAQNVSHPSRARPGSWALQSRTMNQNTTEPFLQTEHQPESDAAPAAAPPHDEPVDPALHVGEVIPPVVEHHPPQFAAQGEIFDERTTFADLGLRNSVLKGIDAAGFKHPTTIQSQLIPVILSGKDVIGQAKTGTGKTAAFGLPLFHMAHRNLPFQSLILAPTRELAIQIAAELSELGRFTPITVAPIYGGQRISSQAQKLSRDPEIIVGTPGRVMDLVERGMLHFNNVKFAVLDEVDRMLDIGFREDIRHILGKCPKDRQTILVSATISSDIERLARSYMRDPEKLVVAAGSLTVSLVKQFYLAVQPWDKRRLLKHLLTHEDPALTLVFCRLKRTCDELARYLSEKGVDAHAIHGDLPQGKRNAIMAKLRSGNLEVLIASDLASRGIDVEGITHVINYDLPDDVELYVHRIGRTARAGRGGTAWSLVTPEQGALLTQIELLINSEIPKFDYQDFEPGPVPEWYARERDRREQRQQATGGPSRYATQPTLPAQDGERGASAPATTKEGAAPKPSAAPAPLAADPSKFPGGIIPTRLPPKRMQGKIRSARR
jgi:ATP-dependent RNA helicase DeaD